MTALSLVHFERLLELGIQVFESGWHSGLLDRHKPLVRDFVDRIDLTIATPRDRTVGGHPAWRFSAAKDGLDVT
jgi:hypothetical protein